MKILFDHSGKFLLSHGGFETQIEQTKAALESIGLNVEYLRWWDAKQEGDIIHYFGRPDEAIIRYAQQKGIKVIVAELLTGLGSRSASNRFLQRAMMTVSQKLLPSVFTARMSWQSYRLADGCVALTAWEAKLMKDMFEAPADRVHVIPNGVEEIFFSFREQDLGPRSDYLVCTATITERKRVLELAEAAFAAQVPVWIVGKPYAETDPYYLKFLDVVRKAEGLIRFEGAISDRAKLAEIYGRARGFVLLSTMETLSLSALEAVTMRCPLLLSDLPWARYTFGAAASYVPISEDTQITARHLRGFYDQAPGLKVAEKPHTWREVAEMLKTVYQKLADS